MQLIFIHGIAQLGNSAKGLRDDWVADLQQAGVDPALLAAANPVMAFYAKELSQGQGTIKFGESPGGIIARAAFVFRFMADVTKAANTLKDAAIDAARLEKIANGLKPHSQQKGEWNPAAIADEIFDYLTKPELREAIEAKVLQSFTGEPCTIVAHSLGTLVAYRLLRDRKIACRRLITIGSPLSIAVVRQNLDGPFSFPTGLRDWRDFHDPVDLVALGKAFPPGKTWPNRLIQLPVDNKAAFGHDADGYLLAPEVSSAVREALTSSG